MQLLFVVTSVVGLVWYNRLRHQLSQLQEFSDDSALETMLMEEDVQSGGRGAVTALKTFVSDDEAAPRKTRAFSSRVPFETVIGGVQTLSVCRTHLGNHSA